MQNAAGVQKYNNLADVIYGLSKTARHTAVMSGRLEARRRTRADKVGLSDRGRGQHNRAARSMVGSFH